MSKWYRSLSRLVSEDVDGTNGWSVSVVNEHGAALSDVEYHAPEAAPAVKVSLDYDVQRAAQEAAQETAGATVDDRLVAARGLDPAIDPKGLIAFAFRLADLIQSGRVAFAGGAISVGSDSNIRISLAEELRQLETSQRLRDHSRAALATAGAIPGAAPATRWVTSPSVCSQISGPVLS